jgi:putative addiction module component (TIGR02574 family)
MTFEQILTGIDALSSFEQIRIVNAIWDKLPDDVGGILPDGESDILNDRWQRYLDNPSSAITEEEFRSQLKEKRAK